ALVMRLREMPEAPIRDTELEFLLPQSRAVYAALDAAGGVPPELDPYANRARRFLEDVRRLPTPVLLRELETTQLRIRDTLIERRRQQIAALLRDAANDPDE